MEIFCEWRGTIFEHPGSRALGLLQTCKTALDSKRSKCNVHFLFTDNRGRRNGEIARLQFPYSCLTFYIVFY